MARTCHRGLICCLSSLLFLVLTGCGGGSTSGSSSGGGSNSGGSVQLTVLPSGGQGSISSTPPGITCGSTCSADFSDGTQVTLTASPMQNYYFAGWSGSCSGTGSCKLTLSQNTSVTAKFSTSPVLSISLAGTGTGAVTSNPGQINCGKICSGSFDPDTPVTLSETPGANSTFAGWSGGGCTGTDSTCTTTINDSEQVTATFNPTLALPLLTVNFAGTGAGSVSSNPPGINCDTNCSHSFSFGTQVTLTETPGANAQFAGWSGNCTGTQSTCTVTLNTNMTVMATFNSSEPLLTVTLAGTGSGMVTSIPGGISCAPTCGANFPTGTQVTLTESPSGNSQFAGWSGGGCSGTNATCTVTMNSSQQVTATFNNPQNLSAINHIIFIAQENRSFDSYFGALREYWAQNGYPDQSFDGLPQFNPLQGPGVQPPYQGPPPTNPGCNPSNPPPDGCAYDPDNPVTSFHFITQCIENIDPLWDASHFDWDFHDPEGNDPAALNGFVWAAGAFARYEGFNDANGIRAMGYYDGGDLNYYYFMASNFATSDRWFMPMMTRTSPNREYLVAATSQGYVYPVGTDQNDMKLLTATTIFQELQAANISWKIYVDTENSPCTGPPYDPTCLLTLSYIQNFQWGITIPTQYPNNIAPVSQYFTDLQQGTLPQVALFEPAADAGYDEHPSENDSTPNDMQRGANYVSSLINGLMTSSYWKDSAFIFTFDEFGGAYDHVSPQPAVSPDGIKPVDLKPGDVCTVKTGPLCDFTYTGYRVPMMVISPYTKKNYVSHLVADNTAILKLIEERFNLSPLTNRDAAQIDMSQEFFDFTNPPWMTPPSPPAQNLNGACYLNQLP
ncbi:MAG TPA: alkaline phosphatase family protein [Terriglobales bacterium]|nr:alkaline phosphatase family protein [Terriglobales bacterium]